MNWGADRTVLLWLYRSIIQSKLDYGSQIYGSAADRTLNKLDPVHNAALRMCTGAFRSSPINSLLVETNEMSLGKRRMKLGLQHYFRLHRLPNTPAYCTVKDDYFTDEIINGSANKCLPFGARMRKLIRELQLPLINALPCTTVTEPRYTLPDIICNNQSLTKKNINPLQLKLMHRNHQIQDHSQSTHIYTDGSRTNNGTGYGIFAASLEVSTKVSQYASIYTTELLAILCAVIKIYDMPNNSFTIFSDSQSALNIISDFTSNHPVVSLIQSWLVKLFAKNKSVNFCWTPSHIGIYGNEKADMLARRAAESDEEITYSHIPHTDYYYIINKKIFDCWQREWTQTPLTNKLRSIKEVIKEWPSSLHNKRKIEVTLTRLRIGHTRITHGYLMKGRRIPDYCDWCLVPLTVIHILLECPEYAEVRQQHFNCDENLTLASILSETPNRIYPITNVLNYLNDIDMINKI